MPRRGEKVLWRIDFNRSTYLGKMATTAFAKLINNIEDIDNISRVRGKMRQVFSGNDQVLIDIVEHYEDAAIIKLRRVSSYSTIEPDTVFVDTKYDDAVGIPVSEVVNLYWNQVLNAHLETMKKAPPKRAGVRIALNGVAVSLTTGDNIMVSHEDGKLMAQIIESKTSKLKRVLELEG